MGTCASGDMGGGHILKSNANLRHHLREVRVAFSDEFQQGGQAGFTVVAANLPPDCLQVDIGDQEQTKTGTGGESLKEALLRRLSCKAVAFLGGPEPRQPDTRHTGTWGLGGMVPLDHL